MYYLIDIFCLVYYFTGTVNVLMFMNETSVNYTLLELDIC